ncbi:MAG: glycosyltransferase family 39 protein [Phycisphaerales bacterium]|nr:glycosyltransferase family 39 protein [Phycisphaerales bacterium]
MLLYAVLTCYGIGWGLPSHADDRYLFAGEPWPAERLAEAAAARLDPALGADVDVDPLAARAEPVVLNATTTGVAEIVRRYRLFTRQPDEMITIMALSGMRPRALQLDPRLYQYGGLFIYPVGAAIGACGALGVYPVTSDPAYYLANPASFGKFYITARAFAAAWGLVGIVVMYELARRIAGRGAGLLAALLFVLLPVVTCMAHEAKPHLPGAVLMLLACLLAMRALDLQRNRDWLALFVCCSAAVGMVLSALHRAASFRSRSGRTASTRRAQQNEFPCTQHRDLRPIFIRATIGGWLVAGAIYHCSPTPTSSSASSPTARAPQQFPGDARSCLFAGARRVELTPPAQPVLLFGITGGVWALRHHTRVALPLGVMALLLALQFVLLGAGKPDEYGRFGVFTNCALAVSAACFIAVTASRSRALATFVGIITVAVCAWTTAGYLAGFRADAQRAGSRDRAAAWIAEHCPATPVALTAEPAPYGCPPLAFDRTAVVLYRLSAAERPIDAARRWNSALRAGAATVPPLLVTTCDDPAAFIAAMGAPAWTDTQIFAPRPPWLPPSRISWANKPVVVLHR